MTQGVLTRIEGIEKEYENLIRIPVPNNSIDIYPIALKSNIYIQSIEDLKKYRIGAQHGAKIIENVAQDIDVEWAYNTEDLLKLLNDNRVDIILETDLLFL